MATKKYNNGEYAKNLSLIRKHIAGLNDNFEKTYLIPKELFERVIKKINKDGVYLNGTGNIMYSKTGFPRSIGEINETKEGYKIDFNKDSFAAHPEKYNIDKKIKDIAGKIEEICGECEYTPKTSDLEEYAILNDKDLEIDLTSSQYDKLKEELKQEKSYFVHIPSNTNSSESRMILERDGRNSLIGTINRKGESYRINFSNNIYNKDVLKVRNSVLDKARDAKNAIEFIKNSRKKIYNIDAGEYNARQALYLLTKSH